MFKRNDVDQDAVLDKVHQAVELLIHRESPYTGFFAPALEAVRISEDDHSRYFSRSSGIFGWSAPMSFSHDKMEIYLNYNMLSSYNVECIANTIEHELWHFLSNHDSRMKDLERAPQPRRKSNHTIGGVRRGVVEKNDDPPYHGDFRKNNIVLDMDQRCVWGIACDLEVNSHSDLMKRLDQCTERLAGITGKVLINQFPDAYGLPSGLTAEQYYDIFANPYNPLYLPLETRFAMKYKYNLSKYRGLLERTYGIERVRQFDRMDVNPHAVLAPVKQGLDSRGFSKLRKKEADAVRREVMARMFYSLEVGRDVGAFAATFVDRNYRKDG